MPQTQQAPQTPAEVTGQEATASSASVGPESAILLSPEAARGGSGSPRSGALCPFLNTASEKLGPSGRLAEGEVAQWPSSPRGTIGYGGQQEAVGSEGKEEG